MRSQFLYDSKRRWASGDSVFRLLVINVICFVVPWMVFSVLSLMGKNYSYWEWVGVSSDWQQVVQRPWTLISYVFFHGNLLHLLFNSVMLYFTAQLFLTFFTQKQYLAVYFTGGLIAAIGYIAFYQFAGFSAQILVGASAAVMAVLGAVTGFQPHYPLRLAIFGQVKLWHITLVVVLLDLAQMGSGNFGGRLSHLLGLAFGFLFAYQIQRGVNLVKWPVHLLDTVAGWVSPKSKPPFKTVHRNYKPVDSKTTRSSRIVVKDKTQVQIDAILDKISTSGYDSLTEEEKTFLFNSGKSE